MKQEGIKFPYWLYIYIYSKKVTEFSIIINICIYGLHYFLAVKVKFTFPYVWICCLSQICPKSCSFTFDFGRAWWWTTSMPVKAQTTVGFQPNCSRRTVLCIYLCTTLLQCLEFMSPLAPFIWAIQRSQSRSARYIHHPSLPIYNGF